MDAPLCFGCKQKCAVRVSKAPNRNYGRRFWACQSSLRGGSCVRWNGWIDQPKKILKCSKCKKYVTTDYNIDDAIAKDFSGLILTSEELAGKTRRLYEEEFACEGCK